MAGIAPEQVPCECARPRTPSGRRDPQAAPEHRERKCRVVAELALAALRPQTPGSVGNREADVYDLLALERPAGVELLIRAAWDRCVTQAAHCVWATVAARPVKATSTVPVPHRGVQPARPATLMVRWCPLTLCPPRHRQRERRPVIPLWAVQALEEAPPAGTKPLEWLLLTTCAVHTTAEALERVDWYACRWEGEGWHRILKSGCHIEARQLETAERLQRCLPL